MILYLIVGLLTLSVACLWWFGVRLWARCDVLDRRQTAFERAQFEAALSFGARLEALERAETRRQNVVALGHIHQQRGPDRRQGYDPMVGRDRHGWPHGKHEGGVGAVEEWELEAAAALAHFYRVQHRVCRLDFIAQAFKSDLLQSGGVVPEGHYADPTMKATVVPFRNGIMLSIAAGYAESLGAQRVLIGNHAGDHPVYPDCRAEFIAAMNAAAALGTYAKITIESPFCEQTKADIVRRGQVLGVPFGETWSCYVGGALHCARCGTCVERREAFQLAGVPDPTVYLAPDDYLLPLDPFKPTE